MSKPKRLDPDTCGCTDCIIGYSVPVAYATVKQLKKARKGEMQNASGLDNSELKALIRRREEW